MNQRTGGWWWSVMFFSVIFSFVHPLIGLALFFIAIALSVAASGKRRSPAHALKGHERVQKLVREMNALSVAAQDASKTLSERASVLRRMAALAEQTVTTARAAGGFDLSTMEAGRDRIQLAYRQMVEASQMHAAEEQAQAYTLPDDLADFSCTDEELAELFRSKGKKQ